VLLWLAGGVHISTVSSNKISLLTVSVNSNIAKNNSKTSNKQQTEKTDRGEMLLEPTVCVAQQMGRPI
jgi:hypothetical protein